MLQETAGRGNGQENGAEQMASWRKLTSMRRTIGVSCCSRAMSRADLPMSFLWRGSAAEGPESAQGVIKRSKCDLAGRDRQAEEVH